MQLAFDQLQCGMGPCKQMHPLSGRFNDLFFPRLEWWVVSSFNNIEKKLQGNFAD